MDKERKEINEIAELIAKHLLKEISEREQLELSKWLESSEHNRELFSQMCEGSMNSAYFDSCARQEVEEAFRKFKLKRKEIEKSKFSSFWTGWLKYAAILVLPILLASGLWLFYHDHTVVSLELAVSSQGSNQKHPILTLSDGREMVVSKGNLRSGQLAGINVGGKDSAELVYSDHTVAENRREYHTLTTPPQCDYHFTLADGTKVWVNAQSAIKYPVMFGYDERVIYARGEIYLEVAKDSLRPFYVVTDDVKIQVLGTSFNVNAYSDEAYTTVTLAEGKIAAFIHSDSYRLSPGDQLAMNRSDHKVIVRKVDVNNVIAWKDGLYIFRGQTLEEVAKVLKRWYDIDFVFDNALVRETEYTGVVKKEENIESFIRIVNEISSFECQLKDNILYIK